MQKRFFADARYFQILFQLCFLGYGIGVLHWQSQYWLYLTYLGFSILSQLIFEWMPIPANNRSKPYQERIRNGIPSAIISSLGLCLILKTNDWYIAAFASFLAISSKYLIRYKGKHIFNPSALAIAVCILLTGKAWLNTGQWGTNTVLIFAAITFGCIIVTKVQKLDTSLAFLFCFAGLLFCRQILFLGWPMDFFLQSVSTGSLLLFSFFMISDPKTIPDHRIARIVWAAGIGAIAFYWANFRFVNGAPVFALVAAQPLVPILDSLFRAKRFEWLPAEMYAIPGNRNMDRLGSKAWHQ